MSVESTMSETPVPVDLAPPEELGPRWATLAAAMGSAGHGAQDCRADDGDWYYHDGGGNWCRMFRYADGRALLIGSDHEYSETYFRAGAEYFQEEETDLLAGGESWWADAVEWHDTQDGDWISFIYAYDGTTWSRAPYEAADGFEDLHFPAVSSERLLPELVQWGRPSTGRRDTSEPDEAELVAARALASAGVDVTADLVRALGPGMTEPQTGVVAARAFAEPGRH